MCYDCSCVSAGILSPSEDSQGRCGFFRQEMQREDDESSDPNLFISFMQLQVQLQTLDSDVSENLNKMLINSVYYLILFSLFICSVSRGL